MKKSSKKGAVTFNPISPIFAIITLIIVTIIIFAIQSGNEAKDKVVSDIEQAITDVEEKVNEATSANATQLTKSIETFVADYEFAKSTTNSHFSNQKVFNILEIKNKDDFGKIEKDTNIDNSESYAINKTTKYPLNLVTVKKVLSAYTKVDFNTNGTTCYWYSPENGIVVVADKEATLQEINSNVIDIEVNNDIFWIKIE